MADDQSNGGSHVRWARLRFALVGALLAAPPARGELKAALAALAQKRWRHPTTNDLVRFGFSTLERWYYQAKRERKDPVGALRRRVRKDAGRMPSMAERLRLALATQSRQHRSWSYQLHYDNLRVLAKKLALGPVPSYATVWRYMKASGLHKRKRLGPKNAPGVERAEERLEEREVRSFEVEYVGGLFHADFHSGSLQVLTPAGAFVTAFLLAVVDDHSRLCGHAQWYLAESAENYVHGLSQAFQKRGLPRAFMSDRGAAMRAAETREGLARLGVMPTPTLPYSPYQNAKQEVFWAQVEGRLMAMLEGVTDLTLALLNEATQAWVEGEYNRKVHSETNEEPLRRFLDGKSVLRASPSSDELRTAFTMEVERIQRRSDGTVTVEGVRFEVPSRFRHLERLTLRLARWDLSYLVLVDPQTDAVLCRLYPLDRARNADGLRRRVESAGPVVEKPVPAPGMAPLLEKLMADYKSAGLPPAYLPKDELEESR
jgi:transposase InsO family protein